MLRVTNLPGTKEELCKLLLQSSRLSRRSGHLQTAWTYLVEARATGIKNIEIDMEESRYLFQKVYFIFEKILFHLSHVNNF